jgi:hypothetical protein
MCQRKEWYIDIKSPSLLFVEGQCMPRHGRKVLVKCLHARRHTVSVTRILILVRMREDSLNSVARAHRRK